MTAIIEKTVCAEMQGRIGVGHKCRGKSGDFIQ